ncbi:OmpA family protein [Aequorivita capsosiphonis]|uniref:OmpA family protein n=1 Tax=Aequorivita capsosiphonis TaxID=487317 RepID=UPI00042551E0|nr:OmpA family protein [Aequorivita capsosiphonis]
MKKTILALLLFSASLLSAQEEVNNDYNKWSIEVAGGAHKPTRPFADQYKASPISFGQVSVGTRYMINNDFGLKLDFGYNAIKDGDGSLPFKSDYYRASLQGVANLGSVMNFETWTDRIGLLFHLGGGYGRLAPEEAINADEKDNMMHVMAGLSPQIKLSNRIALTTDLTVIGNVRQNYTWDGTELTNSRGFNGMMINVSAGLTFYLGKNEKHADWVSRENTMTEELDSLNQRLTKIETDLIDTDQDGVPDYLDREPNTISGVAVNTKGIAIDLNKNGIPDEIEASLDQRYAKMNDINNGNDISVKELLSQGYVNVYFQFNSDKPETYSLQAINYLVKYMNEHPSSQAELIGYADEIGAPEYNQQLSEKRAKRVYDILIASGVSESRLSYTGGGVDSSVDKASGPARQLVRRVTFKLK